MKAAILALSFVFAVGSLSAQTNKKPEPKTQTNIPVQPVPPAPVQPQIFNFRIENRTLNLIIMAIQSSTELDANTSNQLVKFLITQANDTTLNKLVIPKAQ